MNVTCDEVVEFVPVLKLDMLAVCENLMKLEQTSPLIAVGRCHKPT